MTRANGYSSTTETTLSLFEKGMEESGIRLVADRRRARRQINEAMKLISPVEGLAEECVRLLAGEVLIDWDFRSDFGYVHHASNMKKTKEKAGRLLPALKTLRSVAPTFPPDPEMFGISGEDWEAIKPIVDRWIGRAEEILNEKGEPSGNASADRQRWAARTAVRFMNMFGGAREWASDARPKKGRLVSLALVFLGEMNAVPQSAPVARYVREEVEWQKFLDEFGRRMAEKHAKQGRK